MKIGIITTPNNKGQIVIPKSIRDALGINEQIPLNLTIRGQGIYIHPIRSVMTEVNLTDSYSKVLQRTKGAWAGDDWEKTNAIRHAIEQKMSTQRKKSW